MTYSEYINRFSVIFDKWNEYRINNSGAKWKRLLSCKAWYCDFGNIIALKSYNTIVAWFDKMNDTILVYGYYSATTQQHITKFINECCGGAVTRINGYCDSKNRLVYGLGFHGCWKRYGHTDKIYFRLANGYSYKQDTAGLEHCLNHL